MHIQKWENSQAEQGPEIERRGFEKQLLEKLFQILQEAKNG